MNLEEINKIFPTVEDCMSYLEGVAFKGGLICPQCKSSYSTYVNKEKRYRCNRCNATYNVKTGTPFYKTKIDLRKWLVAISLNESKGISTRELAKEIKVAKDTAWLILDKLEHAAVNYKDLMQNIISKVHELNNLKLTNNE